MKLEPEEIPIKTAPTFSKDWNADDYRSDNQRQHDILSRGRCVLKIKDCCT